MIALAFGFAWLGYSYGLYGWCLLKGYDVTLHELMNPVHQYNQWPPGQTPDNQIFPSAKDRTSGSGGGGQATLA